jgi:hypothetical protein
MRWAVRESNASKRLANLISVVSPNYYGMFVLASQATKPMGSSEFEEIFSSIHC